MELLAGPQNDGLFQYYSCIAGTANEEIPLTERPNGSAADSNENGKEERNGTEEETDETGLIT